MWADEGTGDEGLLAALPPPPRTGGELRALARWLRALELPWRELARRLPLQPGAHARLRLHRCTTWEVLLLGWLPGQASDLHDHGGSVGLVRLLAGRLDESRLGPSRGGHVVRRRRVCAPAVLVEGPRTVHRIENLSDAPAVSLHLYAPPLPER